LPMPGQPTIREIGKPRVGPSIAPEALDPAWNGLPIQIGADGTDPLDGTLGKGGSVAVRKNDRPGRQAERQLAGDCIGDQPSGTYSKPRWVSVADVKLIHRIDRLHIATPMKRTRIAALYRRRTLRNRSQGTRSDLNGCASCRSLGPTRSGRWAFAAGAFRPDWMK
jgi:hypothetical protein